MPNIALYSRKRNSNQRYSIQECPRQLHSNPQMLSFQLDLCFKLNEQKKRFHNYEIYCDQRIFMKMPIEITPKNRISKNILLGLQQELNSDLMCNRKIQGHTFTEAGFFSFCHYIKCVKRTGIWYSSKLTTTWDSQW